jgi:hypothetical protein
MSGTTFNLAAARRILHELTPRTAVLIGSMTDLGISIPGSEWTVGEAAAHLALGAELYAQYAHGIERPASIDRADLAGSRRRKQAERMTRGARQLGADLQLGIDSFLTATEGRVAEDLLPWHQGTLPCITMTGLLIGEQLLHGYDIAQAINVEWPIGDQPARRTVQAVLPVLPALVDSEATKSINATYELAIDGGPRVIVRFPDGTASVDPAAGTAIDCQLSGDPVAWLLALYGRVSWEQLLHTGRVRVTSGDTALGKAFKQLLRNP